MTIENDDQALRKELDDIVGSMDQWSTPLNPSDVQDAKPSSSPTFDSLSNDGTIDGLTLSSRLDRETELLNQQASDTINTPGVFGQSWGIQTPEETQATLAARQSGIDSKRTSLAAPPSALGEFFGAINRNLPAIPQLSGRMTADQMREQIRKDLDKEQTQLDRVSADPNYRARSATRNFAENTAQGLGSLAGSVVEGVGVGAGFAGNAIGFDVTSSDNTIAAVGRWTQARAKAAFPGDAARQEDFQSKLAQGIGSLAGFYGVNAASIAAKLTTPMRTALVAMVGSMSTGSQTYGEARNSVKEGRDVSDRQLLLSYLGGLIVGASEATPITHNLPGMSPKTKSAALAYLATMGREGFEESLQEGFQQFTQNAIAMGHDPARALLDGVGENALIGFLTGGGAQALQLASSKSARQNSIDEASPDAEPRAAADAPQQAPTQGVTPATAAPQTATPGQPFTVDLSEVYGNQLAASARPAYNPANEISGSARQNAIGSVVPLPAPSFAEMREYLPADENGDPDLEAFYEAAEALTGKRYWNQLDDTEKGAVVQALAAEQGVAQAPQMAAGAVASPDGAKPAAAAQAAPAPAAQQQPTAQGSGQINPPQGGAELASNLPTAAPAQAIPPEVLKATAKAAKIKPEQAGEMLGALQQYTATRGMTVDQQALAAGNIAITDRNGKSFSAPVAEIASQLAMASGNEQAIDQAMQAAWLDPRTNDQAVAEQAAGPDLADPALALANQLYDAKTPAAEWPTPAIVAGQKAGLVRLDREGTPRRGFRDIPETDTSADDVLTDAKRRDLAEKARNAAGPMRPARFGETHADGDPIAIRVLVDNLSLLPPEVLKSEYSGIARLERARNPEQMIARIAQGLMAREIAVADPDARLSNYARDLIDQTVEDAFKRRPISETVMTAEAQTMLNGVVDNVLRVARNLDPSAVELLNEHGESVLKAALREFPLEDIAAMAAFSGSVPSAEQADVLKTALVINAGRLTKHEGVHASEKTIDEIVEEAGSRENNVDAGLGAVTETAASDDIATLRAPETLIEGLAKSYGRHVSNVARKYAIALEKIGTDTTLFYDLKKKIKADKSVKKADLDAVTFLYGSVKPAQNKSLAVSALEAEFIKRSQAETDRATLTGEKSIITRDSEAHANDRRRAERDSRLRQGERALSEGITSSNISTHVGGWLAGGNASGDGDGSGLAVSAREWGLEGQSAGIENAVRDAGESLAADIGLGQPDRDGPDNNRTSWPREGSYTVANGKIQRIVNGQPVEQRFIGKILGRVRALVHLREGLEGVLNNAPDAQAALRKSYEAFVAKYGPINKVAKSKQSKTIKGDKRQITVRQYPNIANFADDPDIERIMALEVYDEKTGKAEYIEPSAPAKVSKPETIGEAIQMATASPDDRATLGAPWIPASINNEFIGKALGGVSADVSFDPVTMKWEFSTPDKVYFPQSSQEHYGSEQAIVKDVVLSALNDEAGASNGVVKLRNLFRQWAYEDEGRGEAIAAKEKQYASVGRAISSIRKSTVTTPDGASSFEVVFEVVDGGSLQSATGELQPRDRATRAASQTQVQYMGANLNPDLLVGSTQSDSGAPIIDENNTVLSGNGRVAAINAARDMASPAYSAYVSRLNDEGFSTGDMEHPVLVRRLVKKLSAKAKREFVVKSNQDNKLAMSPAEQARVDQDMMSDDVLAMLDPSGDSWLGSISNRNFVRAVMAQMPIAERGAFVGQHGDLTPAGRERLEGAIFARAYSDPSLVGRMIEDQEAAGLRKALIAAAPSWAQMRATAPEEFDVTPNLVDAIKTVMVMREQRVKPADFFAQADAFNEVSPLTQMFVEAFYNETGTRAAPWQKTRDDLKSYAMSAMREGNAVGDLMGGKPSPDAMLKGIVGRSNSSDLFSEEMSALVPDVKARAEAMGFDTSTTWYHGTPDSRGIWSDGFKTLMERYNQDNPKRIYFFAKERRVAKTYADDRRAFDYQNSVPEVIPVYLRMKNMATIDWQGRKFRGGSTGEDFNIRDEINKARAAGKDGVIIKNVIDTYDATGKPSTIAAVFEPNQIRSVNAVFDPVMSDSTDIMSALVGDQLRTHELPGYGTPEFEDARQFNVDGQSATGYKAGVDLLTQKAENFAGEEGVASDRKAILLLGPPGAGKSTIAKALAPITNSAYVSADHAKEALPEYDEGRNAQGVHPESKRLADLVAERLAENGKNFIWEQLGRQFAGVEAIAQRLKAEGYTVKVVSVSADRDTLAERISSRAQKEGRVIDLSLVDDTLKNLPDTLEGAKNSPLFSGVTTIDNGGEDAYISSGKDNFEDDTESNIQSRVRESRLVSGSRGPVDQGILREDGRAPQGEGVAKPDGRNNNEAAQDLDDGSPFVGEKEARYQQDMRAFKLRTAIIRELKNAQNGTSGSGIGISRQSGITAEGQPGAQSADRGSASGDAISKRLASRAFRARAIDAFLSPELRQSAVQARATSQGFTMNGYHGTRAGEIDVPNPYMPGLDFGFHVGIGTPKAANSRLGYASTFAEKLDNFLSGMFGGPSYSVPQDDGSIIPVKMRVSNPLRLPDVGVMGGGAKWSDPLAMAGVLSHPQSTAPESLKRWIKGWIASNGAQTEGRRRVIRDSHIFSRAFAAELDRLGYDAIIYKNLSEGYGLDSLFVWDASRARSAFDMFHDDAAGAEGLTASDAYVEQDLKDRIAELMREDGIDDGQEVYSFDELSALKDADELGYFSGALRAAKNLRQDRGTPEQMLAMLKKEGAKDSEIEATGLSKLFGSRESAASGSDVTVTETPSNGDRSNGTSGSAGRLKQITKEEIIAHLEANAVKLNEGSYGETPEHRAHAAKMDNLREQMMAIQKETAARVGHHGGQELNNDPRYMALVEEFDKLRDTRPTYQNTKWSAYSLDPSNPTYRETVLHLPSSKSQFAADKNLNALATEVYDDAIARGATAEQADAFLEEIGKAAEENRGVSMNGLPFDSTVFAEKAARAVAAARALPDFQSGHFSEPNIIGHMMTSMVKVNASAVAPLGTWRHYKLQEIATGKGFKKALEDGDVTPLEVRAFKKESVPVYLIDQIQSDWGQKLRDGGVRDEAKIAELKARIKDLGEQWTAEDNRTTLNADARALADAAYPDGWLPANSRRQIAARKSSNQWEALQALADDASKPIEMRERASELRLVRNDANAKYEPEITRLKAELRTAEASTPGNPLVNTTDQWTNTTLRRAIRQAAEADAEYIAMPSGDTVLSYNPGDTDGMRGFYGSRTREGIVPKNLRKLLQKLDKDSPAPERVTKLETPSGTIGYRLSSELSFDDTQTGFTLFKLTDKVKQSVLEEGQPLFALRDKEANKFGSELAQFLSSSTRNTWINVDGVRVYIRKSRRHLPGDDSRLRDMLDIANVRIEDSGQGTFRQILPMFERQARSANLEGLFVENVETDKFAGFFRQNGWIEEPGFLPSFYKPLSGSNSIAALAERGNLRLTPDAQEKHLAVMAELKARLTSMLPSDVAVNFADRLFSKQGQEQYGRFRPDVRTVELALAHGAQKAIEIGGHEVVHVLREAGAFTDAEWQSLVDRAHKLSAEDGLLSPSLTARYRRAYEAQAVEAKMPPDLAKRYVERRVEEEMVARLAELHFGPKQSKFGAAIDGLLQRLADILDAIVAAFNGQGMMTPDAVFRRMEKGTLAKRVEPKPQQPTPEIIRFDEADTKAIEDLWPEAQAASEQDGGPATRRRFDMPGYDATVKTSSRADGTRTRVYSIAKDGKALASMALSESEPDQWSAIGLRLDKSVNGKGLSKKLFAAIGDDLGRQIRPDGIIAADTYRQIAAQEPDRVRFHVKGGGSLDGLYVPAASVEMMRNAADKAAAAVSGEDTSDAPKAAVDFKSLERRVPDLKFYTERIEQEMSALAPRKAPPAHMPNLGNSGSSDLIEPSVGLSDLVTMVNESLDMETRMGRLNPGLKAQMGRLGYKLYGQFSRKTGITRMAIPNDLPTLVHEGGHKLENHPELAPAVEAIKQTFAAELTPLATPGKDQLSEGWAEWFTLFLIDPQTASQKAPGATASVRQMLEQEAPELLIALETIQAGYAALVSASPGGVVLSRVKTSVQPTTALGERAAEVKEKGWRGAISDWMYSAVKSTTDDKHPLKVARDFLIGEARRNLGKKVSDKDVLFLKAINDPYKLGRMMEHARVHATAKLRNGIVLQGRTLPSGPSMQDVMATAFGGLDKKAWNETAHQKFGAYLVARRMNAEWDRFDLGFLDGPPDNLMPRQAWAKAQNDFELAHPEFKKAATKLDVFVGDTLLWKRQNGFLTEEQYLDYSYRDGYAPLNRVMDDKGPSSLNSSGSANKRQLMFRFKGSTRDFINPIESIIADVYATQTRVELNHIIKSLIKAAEAAGPSGGRIAERIPAMDMKAKELNLTSTMDLLKSESEKILQKAINGGAIDTWDASNIQDELDVLFDANAAQTLFSATATGERGERIVYFWEDGKRIPVLLGSDQLGEDIFNIMAGVGQPITTEPWFDGAVLFTQTFRAGVTKSPAYIVVNWFRDQLATWALSRDFTPFWSGLKGLGDVVAGNDAAKMYENFAGMMGGIDANIVDTAGRGRDALQLRKSGYFAAPTTWQSILRSMEITEAASRIGHMKAAYERLLSQGYSEEEAAFEAAYIAHDVMDFSRHGSKMIMASRLVAFMNAQLQGLSAALRTARGERDSYVNVRDMVTPYLKAAEGIPLSVGEREALPTSQKMWMKLASIGMIGLALAMLYEDDPEYEELTKSNMGHTHWFFKLGGKWWRAPKPFELAIFSNLFEAMFAKIRQGDELATERFMRSIRETMFLSPEMQTFGALKEIAGVVTAPLNKLTGPLQYGAKPDDNLPMRLKGLPPEMQWDAYTSEFSKMVAATFGISPYKTDNFIRTVGASVGRDVLNVSDYVLPRLNQATGGNLPGVSDKPRADKSFEDTIFLSRITRRAPRGAYSTTNFWQEMSLDNGRFTTAAKGYKRYMDELRSPRDAQRLLSSLDEERKAYVLLEYNYKEADQDMHPLNRAKQVIGAMSGIRRQMAEDNFYIEKTDKKGREAVKIELPPSTQRVVNEIFEDLALAEARNAQILLRKPGWIGREEMPTGPLIEELKAAAPDVAEEYQYRITHGRNKTYTYDGVKAVWPDVRKTLLSDDPGVPLGVYRSQARSAQ